jgi:deazaflavin-dependent oxidoreductase (nitroreductase family)
VPRPTLPLRIGNAFLEAAPPRVASVAWNMLQGSHLALFRMSGGHLGSTFGKVNILFLHHVGRQSGTHRVSPLLYVEDGPRIGIIASKGGHPRHPAWFHNLVANPDTEVEMRGGRRQVHARIAEGEERELLWAKAVAVWPDYERYQARTGRLIPVVVLDPRG